MIERENDQRAEDPAESVSAEPSAGTSKAPGRGELVAAAIIATYFLAKLLFFANAIAPDIPPDEPTHIGIIELYRDAPLMATDSPRSFHLGLVARTPFLYYLLMGKLLHLNVIGLDDLLFLRLLNVLLSLTTVFFAWRLVVRVSSRPAVRLLALALITNTLMFTFISAAVSYDNLVNLLAVIAVLAFVRYIEEPSSTHAAILGLACLAGGLTKMAFLPLAAILALLVLLDRRASLFADLRRIAVDFHRHRGKAIAVGALTAILLGGNLWIYGLNELRYGRLVPGCDRVLPLEACLENRIFARNWVINQYRNGQIDYQEALRQTSIVRHPGDRDYAVRLITNERLFRQNQPELLNPIDYMAFVWMKGMKPSIFGIQAHPSIMPSPNQLLPQTVLLLAALLMWCRYLGWERPRRRWLYLGLIALAYYAILVGWYNYRLHLASHAPLLAVQGRYIFPVLVPAFLAMADALLRPFRSHRTVTWLAAAAITATFVATELPFFLANDSDSWYSSAPTAVDHLGFSQSRMKLYGLMSLASPCACLDDLDIPQQARVGFPELLDPSSRLTFFPRRARSQGDPLQGLCTTRDLALRLEYLVG